MSEASQRAAPRHVDARAGASRRAAIRRSGASQRTSIAITALGGQGGGVLTQWIVALAEANGQRAQSTSVPGVAQRTGATIYYIELFPEDAPEPVLALMPTAGDVDICIASELVEAGRAVERGFVTPDVTTLIASDSRVYAISEKQALGDGRANAAQVREAARAHAKRLVLFDMQARAEQSGALISAVLFGALAGSGALPFPLRAYEDVVRASGRAVETNLRGLHHGHDDAKAAQQSEANANAEAAAARAAQQDAGNAQAPAACAVDSPSRAPERGADVAQSSQHSAQPAAADAPASQAHTPKHGADAFDAALVAARVRELGAFPEAARETIARGVLRLRDYQDARYADLYLKRLRVLARAGADAALQGECARRLALWMSFEDVIRVADWKTRGARFREIEREVRAAPGQFWYAAEFTHPRFEEFCGTLPARLGGALARSDFARARLAPLFEKGRVLQTGKLGGFLLLWTLARLRRFRRGTLRYQSEQARIEDWLSAVHEVLARDAECALEVARCARLLKGYGDTHARGRGRGRTAPAARSRARRRRGQRLPGRARPPRRGTARHARAKNFMTAHGVAHAGVSMSTRLARAGAAAATRLAPRAARTRRSKP